MSILLEDKIKERLKDLANQKVRFIIEFNYGEVNVIDASIIDELAKENSQLRGEIDELESEVNDLEIQLYTQDDN